MAINDCKNTSAKLNVLPMIWHEPLMAVSQEDMQERS